jgi:antitoxin ParD1/3/4
MRSSMHISLPAPLKAWVEQQVDKKGFSTASEYVREVLRREQAQEARARIDGKLLAAIESGESTPLTRNDWARIRQEGLKRSAVNRRKK